MDPDIDLIDTEIMGAMKLPGCPVCTLLVSIEDRYLRSLLREGICDAYVRARLRRGRGLCHRHAWALQELEAREFGDGMSNAILEEDILLSLLEEDLEQSEGRPSRRRWLRRRAKEEAGLPAGALRPGEPCAVCAHLESFTHIYCKRTADRVNGSYRDAYVSSDGLCLPHFIRTLDLMPGASERAAVIAMQRRKIEGLVGELREYIRKHDYRFRNEPKGPEQDAWIRAVRLLVGNREAHG
ncbi:MAG: DUF6062 family protein [Thermoanaerobacterales bacterium]|nr:DUF6062 family protein [Bacillota bacterium]MDI6907106.1 DUF6062 family protein [Thermoanaerobacterales bacterium]